MKFSRKAQISMEYLAIFSIAFLMTFPLIIMYVTQSNNVQADVTQVQVYKIASKISDYAEQVYFMGEPAQRTLYLDFPLGINNVSIQQNLIVFNVTTTDLTYLVQKETLANLSGHITTYEGTHVLIFKTVGNTVVITER